MMAHRKRNLPVQIRNTGQHLFMTRRMYREIRHLQTGTGMLIPKLPFARVVREIIMEEGVSNMRIQLEALKALQEACEMYIVQLFEDGYVCSLHAKRKTLMIMDIQLVRMLRGRQDIINH